MNSVLNEKLFCFKLNVQILFKPFGFVIVITILSGNAFMIYDLVISLFLFLEVFSSKTLLKEITKESESLNLHHLHLCNVMFLISIKKKISSALNDIAVIKSRILKYSDLSVILVSLRKLYYNYLI